MSLSAENLRHLAGILRPYLAHRGRDFASAFVSESAKLDLKRTSVHRLGDCQVMTLRDVGKVGLLVMADNIHRLPSNYAGERLRLSDGGGAVFGFWDPHSAEAVRCWFPWCAPRGHLERDRRNLFLVSACADADAMCRVMSERDNPVWMIPPGCDSAAVIDRLTLAALESDRSGAWSFGCLDVGRQLPTVGKFAPAVIGMISAGSAEVPEHWNEYAGRGFVCDERAVVFFDADAAASVAGFGTLCSRLSAIERHYPAAVPEVVLLSAEPLELRSFLYALRETARSGLPLAACGQPEWTRQSEELLKIYAPAAEKLEKKSFENLYGNDSGLSLKL